MNILQVWKECQFCTFPCHPVRGKKLLKVHKSTKVSQCGALAYAILCDLCNKPVAIITKYCRTLLYRDRSSPPASWSYILKIQFKPSVSIFCHHRIVTMGIMYLHLKYGKICVTNKGDNNKKFTILLVVVATVVFVQFRTLYLKTLNSTNLKLCAQVGFHEGSCNILIFSYIVYFPWQQ